MVLLNMPRPIWQCEEACVPGHLAGLTAFRSEAHALNPSCFFSSFSPFLSLPLSCPFYCSLSPSSHSSIPLLHLHLHPSHLHLFLSLTPSLPFLVPSLSPLHCFSYLALSSHRRGQQMALQQVIMTQDKLLN